jgi:putative ABC transport system permease protein
MSVLDDVRYAARALMRAPIFTLMVVVTLALGIGANAAVFTVVNSVLIKKLPYADPDRLVAIRFRAPGPERGDASVPSPAIDVWAAESRTLESVAAFALGEMPMALPSGEPIRAPSAAVSPSLFGVLGVGGVQAGRPFGPEDFVRGAPRVAIVSHTFWRDRLGAAQDLTPLRLSGGMAVVGVMSESFQFPDVIAPDVLTPLILPPGNVVASLRAIARLRPSASVEGSETELAEITRVAGPTFPSAMASRLQRGDRPDVLPLQRHLAGDFRPVLLIALGVAGAILLIACANVAGLLLARITARERELAIRIAIGGTPMRLARLLLTESVMLAAAGGAAAVLTVHWSLAALRQALLGTAPHAGTIAIDATVAAGIVLAVLLSAGLCAAIPVSRVLARGRQGDRRFGASRMDHSGIRHVAGRALVVGQLGVAVVLLVGALLLLGTLWRLTNANVGFDPHNVLTLRVPGWLGSWPQPREAALDEILRRIEGLPGVASVGATTSFPLDGHGFGMGIVVDNQPPSPVTESGIGVDVVSSGYFRTMRIPVVTGRTFDDRDTSSAPRVAIVNEAFVRWKNLTNRSALERRISFGSDPQYAARGSKWSIEIAGVVADVKDTNPGDEPKPIVYLRYEQAKPNIGWGLANIVVRTAPDPVGVSEPVRQAIQAVVPGATVYDIQPMERRIAKLLAPQRQRAVVFGLFGLTAALLAAIGLYGLLAYIVSQEMREFGIRLAIGASRAHLAGLVLRRGLVSAAIGLVVGLAGAGLLTRVLAGMLYGVTAADPATYAAAAAIMLVVAAIASYGPARRAMAADPLAVLRSE